VSVNAGSIVPEYRFAVGFPFALQQSPAGLTLSQFQLFDNVVGLEFQPAGTSSDVLIGMDIIRQGHLTIDPQGPFCFSF
jgi:hypothetical protein